MVNQAVACSDKNERNKMAKAIIGVMGNLNPHLRDVPDFQHKLWDQLFIMSEFNLDVDSPFPKPSKEIFSFVNFDIDKINKRVQELSFLNAGVNILVEDKKTGKSKKFSNSGGLSSYVKFLKGRKQNISEIFHCEGEQDGLSVEIALQWNDAYSENVLCYTNNIPQKDGGTHLSGFRSSLTRVMKTFIRKEELNKKFRNKDSATNVLSFPDIVFEGIRKDCIGEIIMSMDIIKNEIIDTDKTEFNHLIHLIIHSMLHLLGYKHDIENDAILMERKEIEFLSKIGIPNPYK